MSVIPQANFRQVPSNEVVQKPEYVQSIAHAYQTTMAISRDLNTHIPEFAMGARNRINNLIRIIQDLRWQLQQAQQQVIISNMQLHALLNSGVLSEPLETWKAGEEYDMRAFGTRPESKLYDLLTGEHRAAGGDFRWRWEKPVELLKLLGIEDATKQGVVEGEIKTLDAKLDPTTTGDTAAVNKELLATGVALAYLDSKEQDSKAEWEVVSVLARTWMGASMKAAEATATVDTYLEKVKEKLFPAT